MSGNTHTKIDGHIAKLSFYSPASNACDPDLLDSLITAFKQLSSQKEVKVILFSSQGDAAFCAGASIKHLAALRDLKTATAFFNGFGRLILAMKECEKIIITAVQGKSVGGGLGIIAASDYVVANQKAGLKLSELNIGIGPLVIAPALTRKMGIPAFTDLCLQPKQWQDASWGLEKGLFNQLISDTENLSEVVLDKAQTYKDYTSEALKEIKAILWQGTADWEKTLANNAAKTAALSLGPDAQAAFKQFNS